MNVLLYFFMLLLGLICLWKSGEFSVRNAIGTSIIYGIEKFTIGFFIFAISTGLPEISSAIVSSIEKVPELSVGDLMGSSLVNMTLILGIVLLIAKKIEIEASLKNKIYQTLALIVAIFIGLIFSPKENFFLAGILLIVLYIGFVFWFQTKVEKKTISKEVEEIEKKVEEIEKKARISPKIDILLKFFASLVFLVFSSWITIHAGAKIADVLHVKLTTIGGILIAVGTSFPEFSLEIHAIRQKEYDLALGDIFGSSLLNVSLVLGILTLLNPSLDFSFAKQVLPFIFLVTLWIVQKFLRKKSFQSTDGYVFLGIFVLYTLWIIIFRLH